MDISSCNATSKMISKAKQDGISTIWDRLEQQNPQCAYGILGICCKICNMGPCRINPFGKEPQKGVCGANADTIVARNLLVNIATGAAAHCDHAREVVMLLKYMSQDNTNQFSLGSLTKLKKIALEFEIDIQNKNDQEICSQLADRLLLEFGRQYQGELFPFLKRVPDKRIAIWNKFKVIPFGIDREIVESLHRTHIGVDNDAQSLLLQAVKTALIDGWIGSMIATEISDILFGTPRPRLTSSDLGVLKKNMVNIIIHGHDPIMAEMVTLAAQEKSFIEKAISIGADGINICAMCCTGNEMLMRHGVKMVGNFLQQELAIITGAVDAMIVDIQCILPSLSEIAKCYHTKFITTSSKAHFPNAISVDFEMNNASESAHKIMSIAIENFKNRNLDLLSIPDDHMMSIAGFSIESLETIFGSNFEFLIDAIKSGKLHGVAAIVGCNNPKKKHDFGHLTIIRELLKKNILVVTTGCAAIACAKAGLLTLQAASLAGKDLNEICEKFYIPPVLHLGSCVDISRILTLAGKLANVIGCDISDLPLAAAAPEWMSQKALSIGLYVVGSGIFTVLGCIPPVLGSQFVKDILTHDIEGLFGAKFAVEVDPQKAATLMISHIEKKRNELLPTKQSNMITSQ